MGTITMIGGQETVGPEAIKLKLDFLHDDIVSMKDTLTKLTEAITKLAIVEQAQAQDRQAVERAFQSINKLSERVAKLELAAPVASEAAKWVDRGVVALAGAALVFVAKATGIM